MFLFELLVVALWLAGLFALYWLIRLAVRHGVMDAHRRLPGHRPGAERLESPDRFVEPDSLDEGRVLDESQERGPGRDE